jgi:hypothetical protein
MNAIAQITASTGDCDVLVDQGITPRAFFWHLKEGQIWDVWEMEDPVYKKNHCVPAWTKEELDVMLGGDVGHPILPEKINTKVETVEKKVVYAYEYVFWDIKSMYTFKPTKTRINPGAHASATILKRALAEGWITADEANDRYNQFFKPL